MKKIFVTVSVVCLSMFSCTNLDEGIYDRQVASQFYATPEGINAALTNIYNEIRGDWGGKGIAGADRGWYDLNETCTDEMMIPIRNNGADWNDGGIWIEMYKHTWTANQPFIENTWNWLYRAVFKANLAVDLLTNANAAPEKIAEAKVLRAYFYYMLMDGWGDVPFFTENNKTSEQIPQSSRATIFNFVTSELAENAPKLPTTKGGYYYDHFNRWSAYALLAKIYLNSEVYTGTARWAEAAAACDQVINNGGFSLVPTANTDAYIALFGDKMNTNEVLLSIYVDANLAPRNIIGIRSLHSSHGQALFGIGTWGGSTVHRNFIDKYENTDIRKNTWAVGLQPGGITYNLDIPSIDNSPWEAGARNIKFRPVGPFNTGSWSASNDFPILRYADVLLMKAEAAFRSNDVATARTYVNQVRARANASALTTLTLDDIYDERGRELCWEGHRRQDMIRFNKFLLAHDFKAASADKYKLFPIPGSVLSTNKNVKQNPGY